MARYRATADSPVFVPGAVVDGYPEFLAGMHGLELIPDDPAPTTADEMPADGESTALDLGPADVHTPGAATKRIEGDDDAEEA